MRRICDAYIRSAGLIGALYAIVPSSLRYAAAFSSGHFRTVYLLRLAVSVIVGGVMGAWVHRAGVALWLAKHRSVQGPTTLLDGALIGAGVGLGCSLLPPVTSLISSSDLHYAGQAIVLSYAAAGLLGGLIGVVLTAMGRAQVAAGSLLHRDGPANPAARTP